MLCNFVTSFLKNTFFFYRIIFNFYYYIMILTSLYQEKRNISLEILSDLHFEFKKEKNIKKCLEKYDFKFINKGKCLLTLDDVIYLHKNALNEII